MTSTIRSNRSNYSNITNSIKIPGKIIEDKIFVKSKLPLDSIGDNSFRYLDTSLNEEVCKNTNPLIELFDEDSLPFNKTEKSKWNFDRNLLDDSQFRKTQIKKEKMEIECMSDKINNNNNDLNNLQNSSSKNTNNNQKKINLKNNNNKFKPIIKIKNSVSIDSNSNTFNQNINNNNKKGETISTFNNNDINDTEYNDSIYKHNNHNNIDNSNKSEIGVGTSSKDIIDIRDNTKICISKINKITPTQKQKDRDKIQLREKRTFDIENIYKEKVFFLTIYCSQFLMIIFQLDSDNINEPQNFLEQLNLEKYITLFMENGLNTMDKILSSNLLNFFIIL